LHPCRAGKALVLHASSLRQERWQQLKETNPILRRVAALQEAYQESENPVVSSIRSVKSTVASWFDENETARVLRSMKMLDPSFSMESFEHELREYIVPEVVDTNLSADNDALKSRCSEAVRTFQPMKKMKAIALI
jgi:mitochondrial import inner membrane translocase subunit TIM44